MVLTIIVVQAQLRRNIFQDNEFNQYIDLVNLYRKAGISKQVKYPRFVIAGAQGCGKSSILESLTGLPLRSVLFVRTRFPIEIAFVRDATCCQVKAKIIIADDELSLSGGSEVKINEFNGRPSYSRTITGELFDSLVEEVGDILEVSRPGVRQHMASHLADSMKEPKSVSAHLLRIELKAPTYQNMTFVDAPGFVVSMYPLVFGQLFANNFLGENTREGVDMVCVGRVENTISSMFRDPNAIILAVMDATQPMDYHERVLKLAKHWDISGNRTIRIVTKFDLSPTFNLHALNASTRSADPFTTRSENGMYVVINRTSAEAKMGVSLHRAKLNEWMLFSKSSWYCLGLPCGMDALHGGLKRIFCAQIQTQIPFLDNELRSMHMLQKRALLELDTAYIPQQRQYLKSAVLDYQSIKYRALPGKTPYFSITGNLGVYHTIFECERHRLQGKLKKLYCRKPSRALALKYGLPYNKIQNWSEFGYYPGLDITESFEDPSIPAWIRAHSRHKVGNIPRTIPPGIVELLFWQQTRKWEEHLNSFLKIVGARFDSTVCSSIAQACEGNISSSILVDRVSGKITEYMTTLRESCHKKLEDVRENPAQYVNEGLLLDKIEIARKKRVENELSGLSIDTWASAGHLKAFAFTFEHGAEPQCDWKQNSTSPPHSENCE